MEGDYKNRVDGIFKKFGKSPTSSKKSLLKRNSAGSGETRPPNSQRDRRTQRSKKSPAEVRSSTTSIVIDQCYVPSLAIDLGALPQITTHLAPSMARCCEKCLPTSRTRFYDNSLASLPTSDILRMGKGNWLTHWWMVVRLVWGVNMDYSIPSKEIRQSVLQSKRVNNAIAKCAQETTEEAKKIGQHVNKDKATADQWSRATNIIHVMAAVIYKKLFRFADVVLYGVFSLVCKGLHYNQGQVEMLQRVSADCEKNGYPVVFLPTHKSHLDYVILSFLLVNLGIKVPHIAAGDNLNIAGFGWLQRHLGGFFIKRKLDSVAGKDILYRKVLHEYMEQLLRKGQSVEFFIEGSRTRTGKPSLPKFGLVSVLVDSVMEGVVNDIYIVPVNISYDKLLEGSFHHELMGGAKKMESLWQAISGTWRMLATHLGHIRVDFAQPFSLQEFFQTCTISDPLMLVGSGLCVDTYSEEEARTRQLVVALGRHIVSDFIRCGSLMSTSIVAFLLLSKFRTGVTFSQLAVDYKWMVQEAGSRGRRCEYSGLPEAAVKHALRYMTELVIVTPSSDGGQDQLRIEPILKLPTVMGLTHLSNQCVQVFLVESVIACSVNSILGGSPETVAANETIMIYQEELKEAATQLCITLAKEFIFALPCQLLDCVIQEAIDVMSNGGIFKRTEKAALTNRQRSLSLMDEDDEQYNDIELEVSRSKESVAQLSSLQNILEPYIEAYWLTGSKLLELKDAVHKEYDFVGVMKQCLMDRSEKGLTYFVESCCMEMTRNAIKRYSEMKMIKIDGVEAKSRTLQIISRDQMIELVNDLDSYRH